MSERESGNVAVIGAGISGLSCARALQDAGASVTVLEKSRGPGGRASTRRNGDLRFDHGAQYFTVKDAEFRAIVDAWLDADAVALWSGRIADIDRGEVCPKSDARRRFVGLPGMSGIGRHLARELEVEYECRVEELERTREGWTLIAENRRMGPFGTLVLSAPAPQTAGLLDPVHPELARRVGSHEMQPCWAVMAAFEHAVPLTVDGAFVQTGPLAWAARNGSKPGRPNVESWLLHATPDWTTEHLETDPADVIASLLAAFRDAAGVQLPATRHTAAHLWRYARSAQPQQIGCLYEPEARVGVCGDWLHGDRLEGAFLSGRALAGRILLGDCCPVGQEPVQ